MFRITRQKIPRKLTILIVGQLLGQLLSFSADAGDALKAESECYQSIYRNFAIGQGPLLPEMETVMGTIAIVNPRDLSPLAKDRNSKGVFVFTKGAGYFIEYPRKPDSSYVPKVNNIMYSNRFVLKNTDYLNAEGGQVTNDLYLILDAKAERNSPSDPYDPPHLFRGGAIEAAAYHGQFSFSEMPVPLPDSEARDAFVLELRRELDRLYTSYKTSPTDGKDVKRYKTSLEKCQSVIGLGSYVKGELSRIENAPKAPASTFEKGGTPKSAAPAGESKPTDQKSN